MKRLMGATIAALVLAGTALAADDRGKSKGYHDDKHEARGAARDNGHGGQGDHRGSGSSVSVHVVWGARDV